MITCITYHCHNRDPILSIFKKQQCVSLVWIFYQELVGGKLSLCVSEACQIFVTLSHEWVRVVPVDHQCHCSKTDHMSEFLKYASSAWPPLLTPDWPGLPLEAPEQWDFIKYLLNLPISGLHFRTKSKISHLLCLLRWASSPPTPLETSCAAAATPTRWKPNCQFGLSNVKL